ncbi:hypothetical protein [Mesorhizobium sp. M0622]|uniref:hypothetical protein n=1 Tax=Mesorhizobium sp. M0622 TaxID=2956975 RepID=UPI00333D1457
MLLLRNVGGLSLQPRTEEILAGRAAQMGKGKLDLVETILDDWLVTNEYVPVPHALDEESEIGGTALERHPVLVLVRFKRSIR